MSKNSSPPNLDAVALRTLGHYSRAADQFWEGTRDHDVSQNIEALLDAIEGPPPYHILDFGCGPGRDVLDFLRRGHLPTGLDGALPFVEKARALVQGEQIDVEVWHQDFLALELPAEHFDGVFANASLFHVPSAELPQVLSQLHDTLRPGGVLFSSNPRGSNQEGWNGERYGVYHDLEGWTAFVQGAGFKAVRHYYRPPGVPRAQQPWLASVWRKPGA